jgi:hypothetical protein
LAAESPAAKPTTTTTTTSATAPVDSRVSIVVVGGLLVIVAQHFICLRRLLELFDRFLVILVRVRMVFFGELEVGFLDV